MKKLREYEKNIRGDYADYQLRYELAARRFPSEEGEGVYYGVAIYQYFLPVRGQAPVLFDQCEIRGFSESREEAEHFFDWLVSGEAMPVSLLSAADNWRCLL